MKLQYSERKIERKCDCRRLRRQGTVPGVIYNKAGNKHISIQDAEFRAILRGVPQGGISTTTVELTDDKGKSVSAVVKEIQYHPTTYALLHVDFQELSSKEAVKVNVPIRAVGGAQAPGVRLGGVVRMVIRKLRVSCLPKDIPAEVTVDVSDLNMQQSKQLSDIQLPKGVTPLMDLKEVAVIIAKR